MKKFLVALMCGVMLFGAYGCVGNGTESASGGGQSSEQSSQETIKQKVVLQNDQFMMFLDGESAPKLQADVYDDGVAVENATLSYEVSNPAVAEVATDGTITAKGVGITEVKVVYQKASATAEVRVVDKTSEENVNSFDEAYVNTYGRTYKKSGKLCLDHVATGLEVAINGDRLTAEIESTADVYLCVYVDGSDTYERVLITPSRTRYLLASGLEEGFHTIRIVKSSEVYDGQIQIVSLSADEFYTAPEKSNFRIEFIGDSITAGYGALGATGQVRSVENSDACSSYAYYTAQALGVDYSMVAIQGICVKANMWLEESMTDVYPLLSPKNPVAYDFAEKTDVVVLNLGTNDAGYITSKDPTYSEQFPKDYLALLRFIRNKNPEAYIICLYGCMGTNAEVDSGITQAVESFKDDKTVYLANVFEANGSGAGGHPFKDAQLGWSRILVDYIKGNILSK